MATIDQEKIDYIVGMLQDIKYGSLVITIHEGHVIQVDSTEKKRFAPKSKPTNTRVLQASK